MMMKNIINKVIVIFSKLFDFQKFQENVKHRNACNIIRVFKILILILFIEFTNEVLFH